MKRLFAAAALAPLSLAATSALAQTEINTAQTAGVKTSTTGNLTTTSAGTFTLKEGGVAVTVDSNNTATLAGSITIQDAADATGVLVQTPAGGLTTTINLNNTITVDDTKTATDTDNDGDLDGVFVQDPAVRYGVRVIGDGPMIGNLNRNAGSIVVKANNTAGISLETALIGNLLNEGSIDVIGDNMAGIRSTRQITGNVSLGGAITATGLNAVGVTLDGAVTGQVRVYGAITATGYRYGATPSQILDADDLLIGGPALRIAGNVGGGVLLDLVPGQDTDGDGIEDIASKVAGLTTYGPSPGLLIGGASNITLGQVGPDAADQFGLSIKGNVTSAGVQAGVTSTAVLIGGQGGNVDLSGGVTIAGQISATGSNGNAIALRYGSGAGIGAGASTLNISGAVAGVANSDASSDPTARGVVIDAGARVTSLTNSGTITATVNGPTGDAAVIVDNAGTLSSITNTGTLSAAILPPDSNTVSTGETVALDLRANTTGVSILQQANAADSTVNPAIGGDILLGAGGDTVNIQKGSVSAGTLSFGAGADTLTISGGSTVAAGLTKGAGSLAVDLAAGTLAMTQTDVIQLSSLNVGSTSLLGFSADPGNADPTKRVNQAQVAGAATLASGSKVNLGFRSKLIDTSPVTLTLIQAGTLNNLGVDASLLGDLPFLYSATLSSNATQLNVNVRRRTAAELGLSGGRAAAFNAFYEVFDQDPNVAQVVFGKTNAADFNTLYNQFLPDYSGGPFRSMVAGVRTVLTAAAEEPVDMSRNETHSWLQEVGFGAEGKSTTDIEYSTGGFGLAGGIERPMRGGGVIGVSAAYFNNEIDNNNRAFGTLFSVTTLMGGVYWRNEIGRLQLNASANAGVVFFESDRRIVDQSAAGVQNLVRQAEADWTGYMTAARIGAAYQMDMGAFYIRPEIMADYISLSEKAYTETGAGVALNLRVDKRSSSEAAAEAGIVFGARFGRTFRWGPELRVAYRSVFGDGIDDTTARFTVGSMTPFTLPALLAERNRLIVRAALRGSGAYANFAVEAGGDIGDLYQAYMGRVVVRFMF